MLDEPPLRVDITAALTGADMYREMPPGAVAMRCCARGAGILRASFANTLPLLSSRPVPAWQQARVWSVLSRTLLGRRARIKRGIS